MEVKQSFNDQDKTWFDSMKLELERVYLSMDSPWGQSGLIRGDFDRWEKLRKPIATMIDRDGSFLDVGCANGFLLECLMKWVEAGGISIEPFGVDYSEKFIQLARKRLSNFKNNFWVGNILDWQSPRIFDYVRTELCFVPPKYYKDLIFKLLNLLKPNGKLLICEYISSKDSGFQFSESFFTQIGLRVLTTNSGFDLNGKELTRIYSVSEL